MISWFPTMVIALIAFAAVVYVAHGWAQWLRRRGHGARLDALHDATRNLQGSFMRTLGGSASPPRAGARQNDHSSTRQD